MFNPGNFNNAQNNNAGQPAEKKSWRIGKDNLRTSTGKIRVNLYESEYKTPFCSIQILSAIGKDPTSGVVTYENRPPKEIPSVLITHELLEAIINRFTDKTRNTKDSEFFPNWVDPSTVNETIDCGYGTKIQFVGSASDMKIRIENKDNKERECTITGISLSNGIDLPMWRMLLQKMYYVLSYMRTAGIDPDKFSAAMSVTTGGITMTVNDDANAGGGDAATNNDLPFAV